MEKIALAIPSHSIYAKKDEKNAMIYDANNNRQEEQLEQKICQSSRKKTLTHSMYVDAAWRYFIVFFSLRLNYDRRVSTYWVWVWVSATCVFVRFENKCWVNACLCLCVCNGMCAWHRSFCSNIYVYSIVGSARFIFFCCFWPNM